VRAASTTGVQAEAWVRVRGETEWLRKLRWGVELWRGSLQTKARRSDKFEQGPACK
jgi:hypothetical protein